MIKELLMAVDLGTSFIKVGVYDTDSNCIVATSEPVDGRCPSPGVYIQKGEEIFKSVINCIKKATDKLGEKALNIVAISFTGQMAGFMGVDEKWNDITTYSCSLDSRYLPFVDKMMKEHADLILNDSGTNCPVMAPKAEWFRNEFASESKKIAKYLMIGGYIRGKMGDTPIEEATINRSYLQWTGLADIRNDRWSEEICYLLNISLDKLPKIVDSNIITGKLAGDIAKLCGLKSGIPLVSGAGDKPAGCLGAAIIEPGDVILETASYAGLSCCVEEYRPDYAARRLDLIPSAIPGEFYVHNYLVGSGITLDWFLKNFCSNKDFKEIEKKIENLSPGSDGIFSIGMLGGRAYPLDANTRGTWMNFNWGHKTEHFYRSLLESFSYEFATSLNRLDELYPEYDIREVKIIGGGAKSEAWTKINADVCKRSFVKLNREDVALWGAAIIAGNSVGIFSDMKSEAKKHVQILEKYRPDFEESKKYEKYMGLYSKYIDVFHQYFDELQQINKNI